MLIPIAVVLFVLLMGTLGLCVNLKMPNLNWTSEIVPIKQSIGVMITMFGGWAIIVAFAVAYFLTDSVFSPLGYLALVCGILLVAGVILLRWLLTKGSKIFGSL